jgi:hypothetical protein
MSYLNIIKQLEYEFNEINEFIPDQAAQPTVEKVPEYEFNEFNEIIPFEPNPVADHLLSRLQAGSKWLTAQHKAWLEGNPDSASDARFSTALDAWAELKRSLRAVFGYEGCVFGPDRRCPEDAPVLCDFCVDSY